MFHNETFTFIVCVYAILVIFNFILVSVALRESDNFLESNEVSDFMFIVILALTLTYTRFLVARLWKKAFPPQSPKPKN